MVSRKDSDWLKMKLESIKERMPGPTSFKQACWIWDLPSTRSILVGFGIFPPMLSISFNQLSLSMPSISFKKSSLTQLVYFLLVIIFYFSTFPYQSFLKYVINGCLWTLSLFSLNFSYLSYFQKFQEQNHQESK